MTTLAEKMEARIRRRNDEIFTERQSAYDAIPGPRVGDYVIEPGGKCTRITYFWPGQTEEAQVGGMESGRFYLSYKFVSYSGRCDPPLLTKYMKPTGRTKPGSVWFFSENIVGAGRGVDRVMDFRIFEYNPPVCHNSKKEGDKWVCIDPREEREGGTKLCSPRRWCFVDHDDL